ncbi:MAG TPA: N-acetylmuramoyl-L-alanine amidase [Deltaproteobacteria bacterium]|nr:N-acetylmuramoyl-L-alanine amidase [Deltaproteobacteria bacterium]HOI08029.1 N-acetylmuramoyl-L-alanine amidase [Deltaproteobacteria bacterium]
MDYIKEKLKISSCVVLVFIVSVGLSQGAKAASSAATMFQEANRAYVDLVRDASKKKIRDNWLKVIKGYMDIAEKYPDSSFAPEARAKGAMVYEHCFKYSGNKGDIRAASQIYQDLAGMYPKSSLADDSLYNAGLLEEKLGNSSKAASLYRRVIDEYAQGDMAEKAGMKLGLPAGDKAVQKAQADKPAEKTAAKVREEEPDGKKETPSRIRKILHTAGEGGSRVVVEMDGIASYKAFVMPEEKKADRPVRLVIDFKGARIPDSIPSRQAVGEGIVSALRSSQHPNNVVRLVLDLKAKPVYEISKAEDPSRIIIDVSGGREPLKAAEPARADAPDQVAAAQQPPAKKPETPSKGKTDVPTIASQLCLKVSKIVIDPGHGGKDPGAVSPTGVREKDITLEIGKLLAKRLKTDGFEVYLTRSKDEFVALEERTTFANRKRADLFISLHINSHHNVAVKGIETYFLNLTTDSSAIEVAARENAYTDKSISDLQLILNDLMLNSKINESSKFANCVHTSVLASAHSTGYDGSNLGVKQAPFFVLLGAQMPSILIELGFITNPTDVTKLKQRAYQDSLVEGIAKGINSYIMNTTYAYSWRHK